MAWNRTDIANRACGVLGISTEITDIDADDTRVAKAIRAVLDLAIESMASEFDWQYQRRIEELSLVDGSASDAYSDDWQFAYRYGTHWAKLLGVVEDGSNTRFQTETSKIPYKIISDSSGRLILTDLEDASADVAILPEEGLYPGKYIEALSVKVAMMAGPNLEGMTRKPVDLRNQYESELSSAKAAAANEAQHDNDIDTPAIRARRGTLSRRWNWRVGDPLQ